MDSEAYTPRTLREIVRDHVLETLLLCDGNRTRTAKLLGISIRGLRLKLHEYARQDAASGSTVSHRREPSLESGPKFMRGGPSGA
jgi:DNA-binding NtrC family response regulator